jgi:hypothetical protein
MHQTLERLIFILMVLMYISCKIGAIVLGFIRLAMVRLKALFILEYALAVVRFGGTIKRL